MLLSWTQINRLLIDPNVVNLQKEPCHHKYHWVCVLFFFLSVFFSLSLHPYAYFEKVSIKWASHLEILLCRKTYQTGLLSSKPSMFLSLIWTAGLYTNLQLILSNWNLTRVALLSCFLALKRDCETVDGETTLSSSCRLKVELIHNKTHPLLSWIHSGVSFVGTAFFGLIWPISNVNLTFDHFNGVQLWKKNIADFFKTRTKVSIQLFFSVKSSCKIHTCFHCSSRTRTTNAVREIVQFKTVYGPYENEKKLVKY